MKKKVILISIDGMRPDGMKASGNPYVAELEKMATYTYNAQTVYPSATLPCHYSMAHSVTPQRHGIITNSFVPQVRPVQGIFEKVRAAKGYSAIFQAWDPIRDIARPGIIKYQTHIHMDTLPSTDTYLTDEAIRITEAFNPDLVFLYLAEVDEEGHNRGWMSESYLERISLALDNAKRMIDRFGDEYSVIIMADHGGHDRLHGTDLPEDMTIPLFFIGEEFERGREVEGLTILDLAPTMAKLLGLEPEEEWEGVSLC